MALGLIHIVRWALYIDVGLLFGMPAVAWAVGGQDVMKQWRGLPITAAILCVPLSVFGFLVNLSEMAAVSLGSLDHALIFTLLTGSALGLAMIARCIAALICLTFMGAGWRKTASLAGGVAVVTLAWSGHGGSSEGALGYLRLAGDMLHLLAAAAWIGALVLFLLALLKIRRRDTADIERVGRVLSAFALPGSVIVALLTVTGLSNMLFIARPTVWPQIAVNPYGEAMLAKLGLFLGMLGFAAVNRFFLAPRLDGQFSPAKAVTLTRLTIALETSAAIAILALVAWLGSIDPMAT